MTSNNGNEKVLIVDANPQVRNLIGKQTLQPLGYRIKGVGNASEAIQQAITSSPDVVIINLHLADLSGKDLLVALTSQGLNAPIIIYTDSETETDLVQAFRLGASDFLNWPIRDTEVVSAVERVLRSVRTRKERADLSRQLEQSNQELERRLGELTMILSLGKAMISITDVRQLFDKIVEGAMYVSEADRGWILIKDDNSGSLILGAHRNLPAGLANQINRPFDDGISSLVALSGETLLIHGQPISRFKIAQLGRAALVAPIKAKKEVVGVLTVVRKKGRPFRENDQKLLEAVADFASISLVNARLYRALEVRAQKLQKSVEDAQRAERAKSDIINNVSHELNTPIQNAKTNVEGLLILERGNLNEDQKTALSDANVNLQRVLDIIQVMTTLHDAAAPRELTRINTVDIIRSRLKYHQKQAQKSGIVFLTELPSRRIPAKINAEQISKVFDHLLTNAIKFSPEGGEITINVEQGEDEFIHVSVTDTGLGISKSQLPHIFDRFYQAGNVNTRPFGGLGIGLSVVKEIITTHGGEVWAESTVGKGSTFHFTLPKG